MSLEVEQGKVRGLRRGEVAEATTGKLLSRYAVLQIGIVLALCKRALRSVFLYTVNTQGEELRHDCRGNASVRKI